MNGGGILINLSLIEIKLLLVVVDGQRILVYLGLVSVDLLGQFKGDVPDLKFVLFFQ